jgi:short-subunit dehydrogenase
LSSNRDHNATHIALTGASSGIGAALALEFAQHGRVLSLFARRRDRLEKIAEAARKRGAEVHCQTGDVRDAKSVQDWCTLTDERQPIDLLVANAGLFDGIGPDNRLETSEEAEQLVATNLLGAIYTAQAVLPHMIARRDGHIAFISSLAARLPAADAPTYSASKAGLVAYAEALREYLLAYGIRVTTVLPGHVRTAQTELHDGPLPMILPAEVAARRIRHGLEKRRAIISLPYRASILVAAARLLPWRIRARANAGSRFSVRK